MDPGLRRSGVGLRVVLGIIFIRYVALPLTGIGTVKVARHLGLVGSDRLYQFVLMLQFAVPPAVAISMTAFCLPLATNACMRIFVRMSAGCGAVFTDPPCMYTEIGIVTGSE